MDSQIDLTQHSGDVPRGRLEVVVSILRPSVRLLLEALSEDQEVQVSLKQVDDVIQELVHSRDQLSNSKIQENLARLVMEFFHLPKQHRRSVTPNQISPEHVVRCIDSTIQFLLYFYNDEYTEKVDPTDAFLYIKKKISDTELQFLRNIVCSLANRFIEQDVDTKEILSSARKIAGTFSVLFFCYFVWLVDLKEGAHIWSDLREEGSQFTIGEIHNIMKESYNLHRSRELSVPRNDNDTPSNMIDQQAGSFFDCLINELRTHMYSDEEKAAGFMVPRVKDQMQTAIDELSFLRFNLLDTLQAYSMEGSAVQEMESLTFSTLALILETGYQIYFFAHPRVENEDEDEDEKDDNEEKANYWSFHLPDLLEAVDFLKHQARDLYNSYNFLSEYSLKKSYSSLCTTTSTSTNHIESVNFLIKNLEELMEHNAASFTPLKHQIETFYQAIVSMRNCLLSEIADDQMGKPENEFLMLQVKQAAYQSSLIIDSFSAGESPIWLHKLGMFVVTNDIKMTCKEMEAVLKKIKTSATNVHIVSSILTPLIGQGPHIDINAAVSSKPEMEKTKLIEEATCDELVGVKDVVTEVIGLLTETATQLKILSIVGMPGIGKTTLANSVYNHPSITIHFHVCAWCCVSQDYERETLLAEILRQIVGKTNPSCDEVRAEDSAQKLYQNLKGKKYLIVMDDIWDVKVWNDLKIIFPDDSNGSRILFTTRYRHLALEADSIPYALRLLSSEESCELLWSKIFGRETCPPELSIVSKRIARNCKGLPLAVVLMAGILKKTERRKDSWEQVAAAANRLRGTQEEHGEIMEFTNVMELGYKHLPVCLRPCFLYVGALLEDTSISVSKLIRLWISQGFVQEVNLSQKSLEQEAKSCLDELIDRSLLMIVKRSSNGGVKACRVHDVLRHFCSEKLQQENHMSRKSMFGGILCSHGDAKMQILSLLYYNRSHRARNFIQYPRPFEPRQGISERAVFGNKRSIGRKHLSDRAVGVGVRSRQPRQLNYSFIIQYELLRTLDWGNVRVESSADTSDLIMIANLVHLRFLAFRPRTTQIPSEIGNLQNLETLIITGAIGYIMLPESLWNLFNLRNVHMDHGFFNFQLCSTKFIKNFPQLDNLKSIATLALRHGNDVEKSILRKLPDIQKLGCKFFADAWDDSEGCSIFPELDFLNELKSLKLSFSGKVQCPCKFSFPSNLKKLSISNARLPWDEISLIGRLLTNLEVLKLLNKAFEGQQWDMKDDEFQKLKFLKLDSLDIKVWNAPDEHLPCLQQLVVLSCQQLEEIPCYFGEIPTLELIEMKWCSSSAMKSVEQILDFQRYEMSNYEFEAILGSSAA